MVTSTLERPPCEPDPGRKLWTRAEAQHLINEGILTGRYELIDGELLKKMGQNLPHMVVVMRVVAWLFAVFGAEFCMCQGSIDIGGPDAEINEPEPDAATLARPFDTFTQFPGPPDIRLLVEVSDSTRNRDLVLKARLYARAGIEDYWVLDLANRLLIAHREPGAEGYASVVAYTENEAVSPLARPNVSVLVSSLLPSQPAA